MREIMTYVCLCGVLLWGDASAVSVLWPSVSPHTMQLSQDDSRSLQQSAKQEEEWKTYHNSRFNFSIQYPGEGWSLSEGLNGSGMSLRPTEKERFRLPPLLGAGGAVGQPSEADEKRSRNLDEDFDASLRALQAGHRRGYAKNLTVLSKEKVKIHGLSALVTTKRYEEWETGRIWYDKGILIHTAGDSVTYHLGFRCSPDDVGALSPIFERMARSFRILGPPA